MIFFFFGIEIIVFVHLLNIILPYTFAFSEMLNPPECRMEHWPYCLHLISLGLKIFFRRLAWCKWMKRTDRIDLSIDSLIVRRSVLFLKYLTNGYRVDRVPDLPAGTFTLTCLLSLSGMEAFFWTVQG